MDVYHEVTIIINNNDNKVDNIIIILIIIKVIKKTGQADGRTDGRHTVTLRFPLDAVSVTRLSCHRQTRATRCLTPTVLYIKVDAQCDKLATDDRHQFITLGVHLS